MAHKHAITIKGSIEFFVKKPDHSFGVEIRDGKGQIITKLYGGINKKVYLTDTTIGEMIDGEKYGKPVVVKKTAKTARSAKADKVEKDNGSDLSASIDALNKNMTKFFKMIRK